MKFDFTKIPGIDAELADKLNGDDAAQTAMAEQTGPAIEEAVTNRVKVKTDEFKTKMDAMDAKVKSAEEKAANALDVDPEEFKAMKLAAEKNPELAGQLEAMRTQAAKEKKDAEDRIESQGNELNGLRRSTEVDRAIAAYNLAHPTVKLNDDAGRMVHMLASEALRFDPEAKAFKVHTPNGEVMVTNNGAATPVDWIDSLRADTPSLFTQPAGSGASGSSGATNAGAKTITRADFGQKSPTEQAAMAKTHTIVD